MIRYNLPVALMAGLTVTLQCCVSPPTIDQCKRDIRCIRQNIYGETFRNTAVGGLVGAAIGAGVGYFEAGGRGALTGALAGGSVGAATAGLVTYYVKNANANALADIDATNNKLEYLVSSLQLQENEDRQKITGLEKISSVYRLQIAEMHSNRDTYVNTVQYLREKISGYKAAVIRKYGSIDLDISMQIHKYDNIISDVNNVISFYDNKINFLENELNAMESHKT